jgi:hypothetical protein
MALTAVHRMDLNSLKHKDSRGFGSATEGGKQLARSSAMRRLIALIILVGLVAGAGYAVKMLPWWALVVGLVALVFAGKFLLKRLIRKLFLAPFKAKGAVLKGATATVHSVAATAAPEPDSPAETSADKAIAPATAPQHFLVDVTIVPRETKGPFQHWAPSELNLVKPESLMRPESDEPDDEDAACEVVNIEALENGSWAKDDGLKFAGPLRLKMLLRIQQGVNRLKFRYYFEEFGEIRFSQAP